jgi:hypothetical protein
LGLLSRSCLSVVNYIPIDTATRRKVDPAGESIVTSAGSIPYTVYQKLPDRSMVSIDTIEGTARADSTERKGGRKTEMLKRALQIVKTLGTRVFLSFAGLREGGVNAT